MKENAVIAALPPMTKYSYSTGLSPKQCFLLVVYTNDSSVFISLFGLCGRKLSLAEEGRKVVSEQATLASLEPRTTSHLRCPSTR